MARETDSTSPRKRSTVVGRKFRLLDGMILVIATALGFGATQALFGREAFRFTLMEVRESWTDDGAVGVLFTLSILALPICLSLTVALIPMRLLQPRPRRWASQPGMMAPIGVAIVLVKVLVLGLIWMANLGIIEFSEIAKSSEQLMIFIPTLPAIAIGSCWVSLAITRRWRSEAGWIDRTGRIVGFLWIFWGLIGFPVCLVYVYLNPVGFHARSITPVLTPAPRSPAVSNQVPPD